MMLVASACLPTSSSYPGSAPYAHRKSSRAHRNSSSAVPPCDLDAHSSASSDFRSRRGGTRKGGPTAYLVAASGAHAASTKRPRAGSESSSALARQRAASSAGASPTGRRNASEASVSML